MKRLRERSPKCCVQGLSGVLGLSGVRSPDVGPKTRNGRGTKDRLWIQDPGLEWFL